MNEIMSEEVVAAVMMDRPRVAVILPCYNEEAAIAQTVHSFREALPHADIYVYDNNSGDRTREIAEAAGAVVRTERMQRSEEHTSELQSLMRISYAVFCLKKKKNKQRQENHN